MKLFKRLTWKARLTLQGDVLRNFRRLQELQWLDPAQTLEMQLFKLKRLLIHACRHVPYYREVLADAGVANEKGLVRLDRFHRIPLLDKSTIRMRYRDLKSDDSDYRNWYENTSGGSTGEPVRLTQDKEYYEMAVAVKMLAALWSGYSMCDRKLILWGSLRDLYSGGEKFKTNLARWIRSEVWFNAFKMTPAQMQACVEQINVFRPVQILGYASSVYEVSRFIEQGGMDIVKPESIMTSAGTLYPYMREKIERVFGCRIFDRYGSREVGDVASECPHHKGLHIAAPTHYVEVLRSDGTTAAPGEMGEIVITNLTNYSMPLVRYRIGDMGMVADAPCTCGRGWPLLEKIAGRISDIFITKSGDRIDGGYFTTLFFFQDWIKKFQVKQEDYDLINISIVRHEMSNMDEAGHRMREIAEKIRQVMGMDCKVNYIFVDDIEPTASGKYRYTISKLKTLTQ